MSAWRVALQELYNVGGTAVSSSFGCRSGKRRLIEYKLATCNAATNNTRYTITKLGIEFVQNKAVFIQRRPGGFTRKNTWISPLLTKEDMDNSAMEYMTGYSDALQHMRETIPCRPTKEMLAAGALAVESVTVGNNVMRTDMLADAVWETMYNFCLKNSVLKESNANAKA